MRLSVLSRISFYIIVEALTNRAGRLVRLRLRIR